MRLSLLAAAAVGLALVSCTGEVDGVGGDPAVVFLSPAPASVHVRDSLDGFGSRVAAVDIELEVAGIYSIEIAVGAEIVASDGVSSHDVALTAELPMSGALTIEARGLDRDGNVAAVATLELTVGDPEFDCSEWLNFFGVEHQLGPATQGIPEPVTASMPIGGMPYRYLSDSTNRTMLLADCTLIRALAESSGLLRERGVVLVTDIGVYNYRCIGGGTPPDCPNGVSQHAYAKAIDIAGYTTDDGAFYSVNDDWVIDGESEMTCAAPTENAKDAFLHEIICAQKARGVWNIVLTPNYNEAHRNHFHVDLTDGSNFLGRDAAPIGH